MTDATPTATATPAPSGRRSPASRGIRRWLPVLAGAAATLMVAGLFTVASAPSAEARTCPYYLTRSSPTWVGGQGWWCVEAGDPDGTLRIRTDDIYTDGHCVYAATYNAYYNQWREIPGTRSCGPRTEVYTAIWGLEVRIYRSDGVRYFTLCDSHRFPVSGVSSCF